MSEPRAWVGDLSAYNAGRLRGEWVDMTDADALAAAIDVMSHGGQSDYFVADYDEVPRWGIDWLGEYPQVDAMVKVAELVDAAADEPVIHAFLGAIGESYALDTYDACELIDAARDAHYATGDSERDAAMEYAAEFYSEAMGAEYSHLDPRSCVDWDAYVRHLKNDYTFARVGDLVYLMSTTL